MSDTDSFITGPDAQVVESLLLAAGLPVADIQACDMAHFMGYRELSGAMCGVAGLELFDRVGLLRSFAVASSHRNQGIGHKLLTAIEQHALAQGVQQLFLLTTTAKAFFLNQGYEDANRAEAPLAIQQTREFSGLCPASASFMHKHL